jgi:hypothetical protein
MADPIMPAIAAAFGLFDGMSECMNQKPVCF